MGISSSHDALRPLVDSQQPGSESGSSTAPSFTLYNPQHFQPTNVELRAVAVAMNTTYSSALRELAVSPESCEKADITAQLLRTYDALLQRYCALLDAFLNELDAIVRVAWRRELATDLCCTRASLVTVLSSIVAPLRRAMSMLSMRMIEATTEVDSRLCSSVLHTASDADHRHRAANSSAIAKLALQLESRGSNLATSMAATLTRIFDSLTMEAASGGAAGGVIIALADSLVGVPATTTDDAAAHRGCLVDTGVPRARAAAMVAHHSLAVLCPAKFIGDGLLFACYVSDELVRVMSAVANRVPPATSLPPVGPSSNFSAPSVLSTSSVCPSHLRARLGAAIEHALIRRHWSLTAAGLDNESHERNVFTTSRGRDTAVPAGTAGRLSVEVPPPPVARPEGPSFARSRHSAWDARERQIDILIAAVHEAFDILPPRTMLTTASGNSVLELDSDSPYRQETAPLVQPEQAGRQRPAFRLLLPVDLAAAGGNVALSARHPSIGYVLLKGKYCCLANGVIVLLTMSCVDAEGVEAHADDIRRLVRLGTEINSAPAASASGWLDTTSGFVYSTATPFSSP